MKAQKLLATFVVVVLAVCLPLVPSAVTQTHHRAPAPQPTADAYKVTGPYTYQNLAVFLIHGPDKLPGQNFLTLSEALKQRKVIVYETRSVNQLAIENVSNEQVFVQSGDIVKGGQQDRVLGVDMLVPPHSGRIPVDAFCVESGRWTRRGSESVGRFDSSTERVATKDLKLAVNQSRSQTEVWNKVAEGQEKLSANVGTRVNSAASDSSFQLALENRQVQETAANYVKALTHIADEQTDIVGYAFAINGQINSADVYASSALFRKLWPSLLKASAIEAIADLQKGQKFTPIQTDDVRDFLAQADRGHTSDEHPVTKNIQLVTRETDSHLVFETQDRTQKQVWLHRSYIKK
ncbi:MAG: hypothetical protein DMF64_10350 [Acidobacteria bacterium]|nr:MAG: hypothetical protein DMF64_10350 [Acidobacteriota bacterium]